MVHMNTFKKTIEEGDEWVNRGKRKEKGPVAIFNTTNRDQKHIPSLDPRNCPANQTAGEVFPPLECEVDALAALDIERHLRKEGENKHSDGDDDGE